MRHCMLGAVRSDPGTGQAKLALRRTIRSGLRAGHLLPAVGVEREGEGEGGAAAGAG
jgi:hypothetical protein